MLRCGPEALLQINRGVLCFPAMPLEYKNLQAVIYERKFVLVLSIQYHLGMVR